MKRHVYPYENKIYLVFNAHLFGLPKTVYDFSNLIVRTSAGKEGLFTGPQAILVKDPAVYDKQELCSGPL